MTHDHPAAVSPVEEAQGELSLARVALAEDDLRHAANHVAGAIAFAPTLPEVHELLAELAARSDDGGVDLFPVEDHPYVGTVVARAHLLAAQQPLTALRLLISATEFNPSLPWADVAWVRHLDLATLDPDELARTLMGVIRALNEPVPDDLRAANDVYLDLVRRAVDAHPDHALVHGGSAGIARRFGATDLAVRWGRRAVELEHTKLTAVWYAYALKADGQLDEALRVMARAVEANPLDLDLRADMSSWLANADRLDEALAIIEDAMRVDPTYDCAVHTAHRLRFQRDGDARHLVALADFIRTQPEDSHRHFDLDTACRDQAWLGFVPPARESITNLLSQLPPEARDGALTATVSALEVPSAIRLAHRECPNLSVTIQGDPPSDMTAPIRPGPALWRYDGLTAHPAVSPPAAHAAELMTRTATPSWPHPVAAYEQARPLGQLGTGALLALMVHPPARPESFASLPDTYWERCAQVFACLGILHCTSIEPGRMDDVAARALLIQIAYGIEDWTTEAALFALAAAAWVDPTCRIEVREAVGRRLLHALEACGNRPVTILPSIAEITLVTPDMVDNVIDLARDIIKNDS